MSLVFLLQLWNTRLERWVSSATIWLPRLKMAMMLHKSTIVAGLDCWLRLPSQPSQLTLNPFEQITKLHLQYIMTSLLIMCQANKKYIMLLVLSSCLAH